MTSSVTATTPTTFLLSPMSDRKIDAKLGVILPKDDSASAWDYYLEYQRRYGWNRGLGASRLVIRRRSGNTAARVGQVDVPTNIGAKASWTEPSGVIRVKVTKVP